MRTRVARAGWGFFRRGGAVVVLAALLLAPAGRAEPPGGRSAAATTPDMVVRQQWDLSCGAAALATILTYQQGDPVSEREVLAGLFQRTTPARVEERGGFSLLELKQYAVARGYRAEGFGNLGIDDLAALGPAIVPIRVPHGSHYLVFRGREDDRLLFADPAAGTRIMAVGDFERVWQDHEAFVISPKNGARQPDRLAAAPADFARAASEGPHAASP